MVNKPYERMKGLSGRESLPDNKAMLFVFDEYSKHNFWMKDMNFPIDIVWLDNFGEVVYLEKDLSPDTFPKSFGPDKPSLYVIEFSSGIVSKINLLVGDRVILPK